MVADGWAAVGSRVLKLSQYSIAKAKSPLVRLTVERVYIQLLWQPRDHSEEEEKGFSMITKKIGVFGKWWR